VRVHVPAARHAAPPHAVRAPRHQLRVHQLRLPMVGLSHTVLATSYDANVSRLNKELRVQNAFDVAAGSMTKCVKPLRHLV